ncbi:MAG: NADH:ubiquinone oxidoreductase subunit NDUFA12 [Rhizobiales bacterium]|nr:NADH:ubiquinone oxidoreductase subunit NDUFA12 [Hyphomicrobiales bacterium]MBA69700.1 NADH:ubiquinone oxidoreductase subunit NDUFA12 [Hyphomicrobiales bacterium]|tara:strand:- start:603 stop:1001 length:399 start_codon:yes stop_codon:yes gene_type:complete
MKFFFQQLLTWWNGTTPGTRFYLWRFYKRVGEDEFGNVYFEGQKDSEGRTRRWVRYNGYSDPTTIPPGWHGWMHHRVAVPPSDENYAAHEWEKPHLKNLTGSPLAYRPKGSILRPGHRPRVDGDYDAWTPKS